MGGGGGHIDERLACKQDGPSPIIELPHRAPKIVKNVHILYCDLYMKMFMP